MQLYEQNPLTAVDVSHLAPSLHLKLMAEPNQLLRTDAERAAHQERLKRLVADARGRCEPATGKRARVLDYVDQLLGRDDSGSGRSGLARMPSYHGSPVAHEQRKRVQAFE